MQRAIQDAGLKPRDIGYINAHATGTMVGDAAENAAVKALFLPQSSGLTDELHTHAEDVALSSTKGAIGHLLGAAGAVESVFTVLTLCDGMLPPTINLDRPGNGVEKQGNNQDFTLNYVPNASQSAPNVRATLTNSFGFGGTNASVCFKRMAKEV